jgi:hypothetical protein
MYCTRNAVRRNPRSHYCPSLASRDVAGAAGTSEIGGNSQRHGTKSHSRPVISLAVISRGFPSTSGTDGVLLHTNFQSSESGFVMLAYRRPEHLQFSSWVGLFGLRAYGRAIESHSSQNFLLLQKLSTKCGSLDVSQRYRRPRSLTGIALLFIYLLSKLLSFVGISLPLFFSVFCAAY